MQCDAVADAGGRVVLRRISKVTAFEPCDVISERSYFDAGPMPKEFVRDFERASRLSVAVAASTADVNQHGPARIVTLSKNANERNFTLSQDGSNLVFRLRTPLTAWSCRPERL
jgi:hypothetical protein